MGTYVLRRLQMIPVDPRHDVPHLLDGLPLGDPALGRCGERPCPESFVAKLHEDYNLDKSLPVQYALHASKVVQGDLGTSFNGDSVSERAPGCAGQPRSGCAIAIAFETVIGISAACSPGFEDGGSGTPWSS